MTREDKTKIILARRGNHAFRGLLSADTGTVTMLDSPRRAKFSVNDCLLYDYSLKGAASLDSELADLQRYIEGQRKWLQAQTF